MPTLGSTLVHQLRMGWTTRVVCACLVLLLILSGLSSCAVPIAQVRSSSTELRVSGGVNTISAMAQGATEAKRPTIPSALESMHICDERYPEYHRRFGGRKTPLSPAQLTGNYGTVPQDPFAARTTLLAVWAMSEDLAIAVGDNGAIVRWDGKEWTPQRSGTISNLYAVWGLDTTHIWAVGASGTIVFFDGKAWALQPSGTGEDLRGIHGADASNLWIVGDSGTILRWSGTNWQPTASPVVIDLYAIWAGPTGAAHIGGKCRAILSWKNGKWNTEQFIVVDTAWNAIHGTAQGLMFAGSNNALFDGRQLLSSCSEYSESSCEDYNSIWSTDREHLWIVDSNGNLLFWDGSKTTDLVTSHTLRGIHGLTLQSIWAVGEQADIWRYNGSIWQQVSPSKVKK